MPASDLLFIHPLLGMNETWSGYLVESAPDSPDGLATLQRLTRHPALGDFDRRHPWLLPARPGLGEADRSDRAVYFFDETASEAERQLEAELRQARCHVGLRLAPGQHLPLTGTWDYVAIGASHARTLPPFALIGLASRTQILITGTHSQADYAWAQGNACTLSSGEFLLARNRAAKQADMRRVKLLELLALIANDADTGDIENIFRQEPKLSYSLLRLVNSAAIAPRSPITSFAQAINLLGRRQLQRWLQLLVYADPDNGHHPNPLLQKAAARGRLMELLAPALLPKPLEDNPEDAAFMVGVFSLLDVLLNMAMGEILQQLPLSPAVQLALGERAGPLGLLLQALHEIDTANPKAAASLLDKASIDGATFLDAQLSALGWAARIHPAP